VRSGAPPAHVMDAFGLRRATRSLAGGQGRVHLAGSVVLRPVDDPPMDHWIASAMDSLVEDGFRVPRPLHPSTDPSAWVVDGWTAWTRVPGEHRTFDADWPAALETAVRFHRALAHLDRPEFMASRTDVFARADRAAWGEDGHADHPSITPLVEHLAARLEPVGQPAQVVHADLAGNLLWMDGLPPAVIDLSPYWRPRGLGAAQVVVDAVLWYGAEVSLAERLLDHEPGDGRQLVLRALLFRLSVDSLLASHGPGGVRWDDSQIDWDLRHAAPLARWAMGV
jgi:uncharacterized protein (TIGR02569 family)